jgi:serine O-acetyltransferase
LHTLWGDFLAFRALDTVRPRSLARQLDVLTLPGFWAVAIFRLSVACRRAGLAPLARVLYFANVVLFGADLSPRAVAGPGLALPHPVGVGLGAGVRLGRNVLLLKGVTLGTAATGTADDGFPTVGHDCKILDGAKLLGPIEIGDGAVIGANALVMRSVPAGAIVAASPGRVVRYRGDRETGRQGDGATGRHGDGETG